MTTEDIDNELRFRDPAGRLRTWRVRCGAEPEVDEHGVLSQLVTADDGLVAVRRWVSDDSGRQQAAYEALENEARAGMRLASRFGRWHPDELTRFLGHDLDGATPFLLVTPPRGRPVAEVGQLLLDDQHTFQVSLLRAVLLLGEAGVVHGDLTERTVHWDGTTAWIGDFTSAAALGDDGVSTADDVRSAGKVILWVADRRDDVTALAHRGAALRTLLDGVFADEGSLAADLLRRLGVEPLVPAAGQAPARAVAEGEREFDRVLTRKRRRVVPELPEASTPSPDRGIDLYSAAGLAVVVAAVAVVVTLFVMWGL